MRSRSSSGIPSPWSTTVRRARPPSSSRLTSGSGAIGRVLQGVLDEVVEHLLEARHVDGAQQRLVRKLYPQVDPLVMEAAHDRLDDAANVGHDRIHDGSTLLEPLRVEKLADQVPQATRLADKARRSPRRRRRARIARGPTFEELGLPQHDRERRTQVVRRSGEELLLEAGRVLSGAQAVLDRGQLARLEEHGGVVGQQLEQPQIVLDEDRCTIREDRHHADAPIV